MNGGWCKPGPKQVRHHLCLWSEKEMNLSINKRTKISQNITHKDKDLTIPSPGDKYTKHLHLQAAE